MDKLLKNDLLGIFGPEGFSDLEVDRLCYSYDASGHGPLPDAVVLPTKAEQVVELMNWANRHRIPVIPRGTGTGYTGGSLAVEGGITLAMERMDRILRIDRGNMYAVVEPGLVTARLHEAVEKLGLFYPPDPASQKVCTIGGNIAENAGGMRAVKYGVTKDYVMGLEVVTPTGRIIHTGSACLKDVVGYDLTSLFVGCEGTLGVVTKAILKLLPRPEARQTMAAFFPSLAAAARMVPRIIGSKVVPATLEILDRHCLRAVDQRLGLGLPEAAQAFLLIEADGFESELARAVETIKALCLAGGAIAVQVARNEQEREGLWQIRRSLATAFDGYPIRGDGEDLVVPRTRIPDIIARMDQICGKYGLYTINYGHAGDGNLHVALVEKDGPVEAEAVEAASYAILEETVRLGGRIAAEHGIGSVKKHKIGLNLDPATLELMRSLKNTLDPNHILNPGKVIP